MAVAKAAARNPGCRCTATWAAPVSMAMPVPMMNVINGGVHADNGLEMQEFMILPLSMSSFQRSAALRR
jgi:enolase